MFVTGAGDEDYYYYYYFEIATVVGRRSQELCTSVRSVESVTSISRFWSPRDKDGGEGEAIIVFSRVIIRSKKKKKTTTKIFFFFFVIAKPRERAEYVYGADLQEKRKDSRNYSPRIYIII